MTWFCWHLAGVRSCYDEGKRTAETLTMDYHRGLGIEVTFWIFSVSLPWFYGSNVHNVLQVRIARIFNTYGPRMCIDDGRVVSNFVAQVCFFVIKKMHEFIFIFLQKFMRLWTTQALRKEPLTVYGDGKQTRSFQYVSDLVHFSSFCPDHGQSKVMVKQFLLH